MMPFDTTSDTHGLSRVNRATVVGAGGFIGLNLCRRLLESDVEVKAIDPKVPRPEALADRDLDHEKMISADAFTGSDVVFHVAGSTAPASSNTHLREDMAGTVGLTLDLLEAARVAGVKQIVHVSSGGTVYGPKAPVPTPETAATDPVCAYGISKLAAEGHMQLAERLHGIRAINLRVANPFGPWQDPRRGQGAVNAFLYCALCDRPIDLWGDGSIIRDFLHVEDVVSAMCDVLSYEGDERVFNIGSGEGRCLTEVIDSIQSMIGRPIRIRRHGERSVDVPHSQLDISRAKLEFGWWPRIDWKDGLQSARAWIEQYISMEARAS